MRFSYILISLYFTSIAAAADVTYRKDIRPLWEQKCRACHGENSPYLGEFLDNQDEFIKLQRGPRMDSYANLVLFTGWPDTGALMRRLDDGKNGKPGNMYVHLGGDEVERQKNLMLFKAWVGEGGWFLGKFKDLDKGTLAKMKVVE